MCFPPPNGTGLVTKNICKVANSVYCANPDMAFYANYFNAGECYKPDEILNLTRSDFLPWEMEFYPFDSYIGVAQKCPESSQPVYNQLNWWMYCGEDQTDTDLTSFSDLTSNQC